MSVSFDNTTVDFAFFNPLNALVAESQWTRPCQELPDLDFVRLGIHRVLESSPSGRGFIQEHGARFERMPTHSNYFSTLRTARREELLADVHDRLMAAAAVLLPDCFDSLPELRSYKCFAADGHRHREWHGLKNGGTRMPPGDKSSYTAKQKRQAQHILKSYEKEGVGERAAETRAWATVNKLSEGGKQSGSGRRNGTA